MTEEDKRINALAKEILLARAPRINLQLATAQDQIESVKAQNVQMIVNELSLSFALAERFGNLVKSRQDKKEKLATQRQEPEKTPANVSPDLLDAPV